ncbi:MAG TPA: cytochrome c biogenesis protein CcdA [Dehalococcoidia bacterium]|nr:cytochrome c biogenesis protein CcdA [Dehalococcoidia bacterium]
MTDPSLPIAFGAGVAAFISPCVLPLVPIYLANLGGAAALSAEARRWTIFLHAISFVVGFSVVYIGLGASVGLIGVFFRPDLLRIIGGVIIILFGLYLLAAMKIPWLNYEIRLSRPFWGNVGYLRSALMGAVFSVGIGTCAYGTLGLILTMSANSQTAWKGAYLLAAYSMGLGIPFIAVGLALGASLPVIRWLRRRSNVISIISGILLIAIGILMLTNKLVLTNTLAYLS